MIYISKNTAETCALAKKIAADIEGGEIFALSGDLGSGKKTFVKYLAESLGVKETITSPTFVIMKEYPFQKKRRDLTLVHIDAYRLNNESDAESLGLSDILKSKNCVTVIEWPERIGNVIKNKARIISFEYIDENSRRITY